MKDFKIKGNIHLTEHMNEVVKIWSESKASRLAKFPNKIDPAIIAVLYGIYSSKELPPLDTDEIKLDRQSEFNVNIANSAETIVHLLFCLWIKSSGMPDKSGDIFKYRERLYGFLFRLLDPRYFQNVLIPFYVKKADEESSGTSSFLHRLWNSDSVGLIFEDYTPEFLAKEFHTVQKEFMDSIIKPIVTTEIL